MTTTSCGRRKRNLATACLLLGLVTLTMVPRHLWAQAERDEPATVPGDPFEFPTSRDDARFHFTSFPDLFNWNIGYSQPGWEEAMDWFLTGMKREGPAFSLNSGDVMDARWWSSEKEVRSKTEEYWRGFRKRLEDKNIGIYIAPGDHEYGNDQGLRKMKLAPVFAQQFSTIFDMPRNGPAHKKGLAYSFTNENLAVISVDTFEDAGNRMSMTVSGKQLAWFKKRLELFEFDVVYSGGYLGDHPHRAATNRPREKVSISHQAKQDGPQLVGTVVIEAGADGNKTTQATGVFQPAP